MAKLTLSVNPDVIAKAKRFARKNRTSVSALVESHLARLSADSKIDVRKEAPITTSLIGLIRNKNLDRTAYHKYLEKKYR